jgi:hypothetical protein
LKDLVRQRSRAAAAPDQRRTTDSILNPATATDGDTDVDMEAKEGEAIATAIDGIIRKSVPAYSGYDKYSVFVVNTLQNTHIHLLDRQADAGRIDGILNDIYDKRPQFSVSVSPADVGSLYDDILEYRKIKGGNRAQFPHVEVLGHLDEERTLLRNDPNFPQDKRRNDEKNRQKRCFSRICKRLYGIIPDEPHFNNPRQSVIDYLFSPANASRTKGEVISLAETRDREINEAKQKAREAGRDYDGYGNGYAKRRDTYMAELEAMVAPFRAEMEAAGPAQRLTVQQASDIGKLLFDYHRTFAWTDIYKGVDVDSEEDGLPAKRRRIDAAEITYVGSRGVPEIIKNAVRSQRPLPEAESRHAAALANEIVDVLDTIIPPSRTNFDRRVKLLNIVSSRRNDLFGGDYGEFDTSFYNQKRESRRELFKLAYLLDDYHLARQNQTRTEPRPSIDELMANELPPPPRGEKARPVRKLTRLEQAGRAEGQKKLPVPEDAEQGTPTRGRTALPVNASSPGEQSQTGSSSATLKRKRLPPALILRGASPGPQIGSSAADQPTGNAGRTPMAQHGHRREDAHPQPAPQEPLSPGSPPMSPPHDLPQAALPASSALRERIQASAGPTSPDRGTSGRGNLPPREHDHDRGRSLDI